MSKKRVLVVGNVNLETSLQLDTFPLPERSSYHPHRMNLSVSGVGFNVARALQVLGTGVRFGSVVGDDEVGAFVRTTLGEFGLADYLHVGSRTGRSLVVSDATGARHVHTDVGGVADITYPPEMFDVAVAECSLAVLTNIDYTRPLLARAVAAGVPVSTDLHTIRDLDNPYDQDYLEAATLLFFSGENLPDPLETVAELRRRFDPEIIVVGLGARGALLSERNRVGQVSAFPASGIVSTVGAGDALHAAFCHFWLAGEAPEAALRLACVFASQKLTALAGSGGFVSEIEVRRLAGQVM